MYLFWLADIGADWEPPGCFPDLKTNPYFPERKRQCIPEGHEAQQPARLFMVGLAAVDPAGPVELFEKDQPRHLVGERHR